MVCTDSSDDGNCNAIFKGGVPHTVVDMPGNCGPGRYAVAVSLEPSVDHGHLKKHLVKRGLAAAPVYDFTFDYDFGVFEKRADPSNVLLRIDYSDDPGYWSEIVCKLTASNISSTWTVLLTACTAAHHSKKKRDLEVEERFGGDHKAWLYHTWHTEKRSMNHEELHARWWSGDVREWYDKHRKVDQDYTGVRHQVIVCHHLPN
jgi:chitinase